MFQGKKFILQNNDFLDSICLSKIFAPGPSAVVCSRCEFNVTKGLWSEEPTSLASSRNCAQIMYRVKQQDDTRYWLVCLYFSAWLVVGNFTSFSSSRDETWFLCKISELSCIVFFCLAVHSQAEQYNTRKLQNFA